MATYEENIDEGTVSFEDGDKAADKVDQYDVSRKVRVELKFQVYEGQDGAAVLAYTGDLARQEVARLLGGKTPAVSTASEPDAPKTRTRRTKAQIEADEAAARAAAAGEDPAAVTDGPTNGASSGGAPTTGDGGGAQTSDDPSAVVDDPTLVEPDLSAVEEDEWASEPEAPAEDAKPITDADLNSAVQKKNAELADPPRIRELIGSYNPDPKSVFQLRQIPADKRQEFLDKLGALKKA